MAKNNPSLLSSLLYSIFLLLVLHSSSVAWAGCSNNIYVFNNNATCLTATGCSFTDPTIWVGGAIPGPYDQVKMVGFTNATVRVYVKPLATVGCLTIQNIELTLAESMIVVNFDFLSVNTTIYLVEGHMEISWVEGYAGTIDFINSSYISVGSTSHFSAGNSFDAHFFMDDSSTMQTDANGDIEILAGATLIGGTLFTSPDSTFSALGGDYTILAPHTSSFLSPMEIDYPFIPKEMNLTFPAGLTSINLNVDVDSTVYIASDLSLVGSITIASSSTVYCLGLKETSVKLSGNGTLFVS